MSSRIRRHCPAPGSKGTNSRAVILCGTRPSRWRLLLRTCHVELYVNDELIQCYTLSHAPGGRLGFAIEAGAATVGNVRTCEMSL